MLTQDSDRDHSGCRARSAIPQTNASPCLGSKAIACAALAREYSRGAHFREDFPQTGAVASSSYSVVGQESDGLRLSREPVRFTRVAPDETIL